MERKSKLQMIAVDKLHPHPQNPRKVIGDVTELAESIKANGILQNLTVVPNNDNWDDVKGCLACKNNCDSCTLFRRIPVQYCKRCGKDFFERKQNIFCSACRTARLHQAQKKYAILHQKQSRK